MLAKRAAPLLVTTMLVAAPAWAQSTSSDTSTGRSQRNVRAEHHQWPPRDDRA